MKYNVIKIIVPFIVLLCFGEQYNVSVYHNETKLARAPKIEPKPIVGNYDPSLKPLPPSKTGYNQNVISAIPDFRSTAGSAGKNIVFAEDGQNVAVVYGLFSGDSTNFQQVYVSYSLDRGTSWINYGPLSTYNSCRTYSGLDAAPNWPDPSDMRIHYVWHQAAQISGSYDSSPCFYAKEVSYPDGLITNVFRLPNSGTWSVWHPCIGVKDSFVLITATNISVPFFSNDCYIWRSTDYGETWDNGRIFFPRPLEWMGGPHFRFGSDGYIFFLWNRQEESNPADYWPFYCESFDYGLTWTQPQLIWQDIPPYSDMSNVTGWWYDYDCEVVNDTPVATLKLSTQGNDYGEIWAYRPYSGGHGNWRFRGTKLVGGDSAAPQPFARYPTIAADNTGNIIIGYQALFVAQTETLWDCGAFKRPYNWDIWFYQGRITYNGNDIAEGYLEFAHKALVRGRWEDSTIIGMIYNNAGDYPYTGNLYFDYCAILRYPGMIEAQQMLTEQFNVIIHPNPFQNSVKFSFKFPVSVERLQIYDITGKLVRELLISNIQHPISELVWDGRKSDGVLANRGVYFYNISSVDVQAKGKIILTR
jgi:hypothetical protein